MLRAVLRENAPVGRDASPDALAAACVAIRAAGSRCAERRFCGEREKRRVRNVTAGSEGVEGPGTRRYGPLPTLNPRERGRRLG